jgi:hypothetical protein
VQLLLGEQLTGVALPVARVTGIALISQEIESNGVRPRDRPLHRITR